MTTKKDIVKRIAEHTALTQVQTKEVVQKSFDAIIDAIVEEGRIELRNFGVFEVKVRRPRKARKSSPPRRCSCRAVGNTTRLNGRREPAVRRSAVEHVTIKSFLLPSLDASR